MVDAGSVLTTVRRLRVGYSPTATSLPDRAGPVN